MVGPQPFAHFRVMGCNGAGSHIVMPSTVAISNSGAQIAQGQMRRYMSRYQLKSPPKTALRLLKPSPVC